MRAILAILLLAAVAQADTRQLERDVDTYVRSIALADHSGDLPILAKATPGLFGWVDIRVDVWFPAISGSMRTEDDSLSVDLQDDLGLEDTAGDEVVVMPMVMVSLGGIGLKLDGFILEFEGSGTVEGQFTFGGITFNVNEDIDSHVKISNIRLVTTIPIVKGGPVALYLQGGVSYFDLEGEVSSESLNGTASESVAVPVPLGGVLVQAKVWKLLIEADVTGLVVNYGDVEAMVLDAKVSIGITVAKVLAIRGGYRILKFDGGDDEFDIDVTLDGFFVGASLNF